MQTDDGDARPQTGRRQTATTTTTVSAHDPSNGQLMEMLRLIMTDRRQNNDRVHRALSQPGQRLDHHNGRLNRQDEDIHHHMATMEKKLEGQMEVFAGDAHAHSDAHTTQTRRQIETLQKNLETLEAKQKTTVAPRTATSKTAPAAAPRLRATTWSAETSERTLLTSRPCGWEKRSSPACHPARDSSPTPPRTHRDTPTEDRRLGSAPLRPQRRHRLRIHLLRATARRCTALGS